MGQQSAAQAQQPAVKTLKTERPAVKPEPASQRKETGRPRVSKAEMFRAAVSAPGSLPFKFEFTAAADDVALPKPKPKPPKPSLQSASSDSTMRTPKSSTCKPVATAAAAPLQIAEKIQIVKVAAPPVQAVTVTTAATLTKQKKKVSTTRSQLLNDYQTQSEADSIQDDKKIKVVDKAGEVWLNPTQLVQQEGSKKGK